MRTWNNQDIEKLLLENIQFRQWAAFFRELFDWLEVDVKRYVKSRDLEWQLIGDDSPLYLENTFTPLTCLLVPPSERRRPDFGWQIESMLLKKVQQPMYSSESGPDWESLRWELEVLLKEKGSSLKLQKELLEESQEIMDTYEERFLNHWILKLWGSFFSELWDWSIYQTELFCRIVALKEYLLGPNAWPESDWLSHPLKIPLQKLSIATDLGSENAAREIKKLWKRHSAALLLKDPEQVRNCVEELVQIIKSHNLTMSDLKRSFVGDDTIGFWKSWRPWLNLG